MQFDYQLNIKAFIDAAEELLRFDEVARALHLLDNLPAYFRDNIPLEILDLKNGILSKLATPHIYVKNGSDLLLEPAKAKLWIKESLRGREIIKDVENYNKQGIIPNIVDHGPGEYWLPLGLIEHGYQFNYTPVYLHAEAYNAAKTMIKMSYDASAPTIFVACEIIEHLWYEEEIKSEAMRAGSGYPDIVHVSTPMYTFNAVVPWKERGELGHLRAYTPKEFTDKIQSMFREYDGIATMGTIMHIRLKLKDQFLKLKETSQNGNSKNV